MKIHLIGVHYSNAGKTDITGFRLLDSDSGQVMDQAYQAVYNVIAQGNAVIRGIKLDMHKGLVGSNGAFSRYPSFVVGRATGQSVIIIGSYDNVGYKIANCNGQMADIRSEDLIRKLLGKECKIANGKVVDKDGLQFISAISGSYDNLGTPKIKRQPVKQKNIAPERKPIQPERKPVQPERKQVQPERKQMQPEIKTVQVKKENKPVTNKADLSNNENRRAAMKTLLRNHRFVSELSSEDSLMKAVDPVTGMTVEEKMNYAQVALRTLKPFYYSLYSGFNKKESDKQHGTKTLGVTLNTLYFNSEFVLKLPLDELVFTIIHELSHVAMRHRSREGKRDHKKFNYACDYYINREIALDFNLEPGVPVKAISAVERSEMTPEQIKKELENKNRYTIKLPTWVLYNPDVDIEKDTPESIYDEIENPPEDPKQNNSNNNDDSESGNDDSSDDSSNDDSDSSNDSSDNSENDSDNSKNESDSSSDDGSSENGDDGQEGNEASNGSDDGDSSSKGSSSDSDDEDSSSQGSSSGGLGNDSEDTVTFRGATQAAPEDDMVDDEETASMSDETIGQREKSILKAAIQRHKLSGHNFGGESGDWIERYVEKALAPKVNWVALVRNYLTVSQQKTMSYSSPDRRFLSRNKIFPGPRKIEPDTLGDVKFCIDTSGSISDKDLGVVFNQMQQLLRKFNAKAEVVYWDTQIRSIEPFENIRELVKTKPVGGGGTDANCIFKYFEEDKQYRLRLRPQPTLIVIFTDGYIPPVDMKHRKYRNTIWVINGDNYERFNAPFGKKAKLKP